MKFYWNGGYAYNLVTLFSLLQVTWYQVHGLTRVGSQLWRTLLGSLSCTFKAFKASPVLHMKSKLILQTSILWSFTTNIMSFFNVLHRVWGLFILEVHYRGWGRKCYILHLLKIGMHQERTYLQNSHKPSKNYITQK